MKTKRVHYPELRSNPKKGGLIDAIHHGRFIDYLSDIDWEEKHDEQIENETNDIIYDEKI